MLTKQPMIPHVGNLSSTQHIFMIIFYFKNDLIIYPHIISDMCYLVSKCYSRLKQGPVLCVHVNYEDGCSTCTDVWFEFASTCILL